MPTRYEGDPYFTTARFTSTCAGCARLVKKGEPIFFYPKGRRVLCGDTCGRAAAAEFTAMAQDEDNYRAGYGV